MNAAYFATLARYNAWANARLYRACGELTREAYLKARPSFFGSIHKTLNHILVADRIWMARFTGEGEAPKRLEEVLYKDFESLKGAREKEDTRIHDYVGALDDERINAVFNYHDMKSAPHALPLRVCLGHLFNHQTHHRGQVHGLLSQETAEPPPLDLVYFALEEAEGRKA